MKTKLHSQLCKNGPDRYLFNNLMYISGGGIINMLDKVYDGTFLAFNDKNNALTNLFDYVGAYTIGNKLYSHDFDYLKWQWKEINEDIST